MIQEINLEKNYKKIYERYNKCDKLRNEHFYLLPQTITYYLNQFLFSREEETKKFILTNQIFLPEFIVPHFSNIQEGINNVIIIHPSSFHLNALLNDNNLSIEVKTHLVDVKNGNISCKEYYAICIDSLIQENIDINDKFLYHNIKNYMESNKLNELQCDFYNSKFDGYHEKDLKFFAFDEQTKRSINEEIPDSLNKISSNIKK